MGAMFLSDVVTVTGKLSSFKYLSDIGSEVTKTFCANCGSPIYGKNTRTPSHLTLSLGTMDDAEDLKVEVVIFERDKPHWDCLADYVGNFDLLIIPLVSGEYYRRTKMISNFAI